jgi:xylulose-5-phosphate/fructose-6-phosphate phosphoketolase
MECKNFRLFSPDENNSNRWQDALKVTNRAWMAEKLPYYDHLAPNGRVMEMLSEHQCQGWLEGYLLTGRHGFFSCCEAFIHIIDSMFNQHAKFNERGEDHHFVLGWKWGEKGRIAVNGSSTEGDNV